MTDLGIPAAPQIEGARPLHSGKVRDLYELESGPYAGSLLMVASDRISAFDFVLDTRIPDKGEILTRMSLWCIEDHHFLVGPDRTRGGQVGVHDRGAAHICRQVEHHVPARPGLDRHPGLDVVSLL